MYGDELAKQASCLTEVGLSNMNLEQHLNLQLTNAKKEVERLTEVISLLQKNPDTKRILELLGRHY
jgi:hypothetical protein